MCLVAAVASWLRGDRYIHGQHAGAPAQAQVQAQIEVGALPAGADAALPVETAVIEPDETDGNDTSGRSDTGDCAETTGKAPPRARRRSVSRR
jgi:hypothetical protein